MTPLPPPLGEPEDALDDLRQAQERMVQSTQDKIAEAGNVDRNISDGEEGNQQVIQKEIQGNGNVRWSMPNWFANLLVGGFSMWVLGITTGWVYCYSQLSVGGRYTAHQGKALEDRVTDLEQGLPPVWLLEDVADAKVERREMMLAIQENKTLLVELKRHTAP